MSAAIASSTPKKVRYSSTSLLRVHARCPGVRTPTLIMSLCTSIPATRSYITLISLPASCNGSSRTTGKTRRLPEPQDQYRRLTHAHAAATGGTRHGAPAADFSTASSGPKRIGDGRQHASIKHPRTARPRQLIRHASPQPPQPPPTSQPSSGASGPSFVPTGALRSGAWILFRIKDHRAGPAIEVSLSAQRAAIHADRHRYTWMYD